MKPLKSLNNSKFTVKDERHKFSNYIMVKSRYKYHRIVFRNEKFRIDQKYLSSIDDPLKCSQEIIEIDRIVNQLNSML